MEDHTVVPVSGLTGHVGWGIGPELPRLQENGFSQFPQFSLAGPGPLAFRCPYLSVVITSDEGWPHRQNLSNIVNPIPETSLSFTFIITNYQSINNPFAR
jgi:hypothetical protein